MEPDFSLRTHILNLQGVGSFPFVRTKGDAYIEIWRQRESDGTKRWHTYHEKRWSHRRIHRIVHRELGEHTVHELPLGFFLYKVVRERAT